jgi:hypothetical protein
VNFYGQTWQKTQQPHNDYKVVSMLFFIMFLQGQIKFLEVDMMKKFATLIISVLMGVLCFVPVASASTSTTRSAEVQRVIVRSESYIGTRYALGGTTYRGIDCSGLTMNAYKAAGIYLSRTSISQYKLGTYVSASRLKPGDLVFFSFNAQHTVTHVGIYLGNGKFINSTSHNGVTISRFSPYWWNAYVGAKRVIL